MKIKKVTTYEAADYPTMEQLLSEKAKKKGLALGGTAVLATAILAGTMTLNGCKPPQPAGDLLYSETDSSVDGSVEFIGETIGKTTSEDSSECESCSLSDSTTIRTPETTQFAGNVTVSNYKTSLAGTQLVTSSTTSSVVFAGKMLSTSNSTPTTTSNTSTAVSTQRTLNDER